MSRHKSQLAGYEKTISHSGLRLTPQRREVYDVLLSRRDHPTAADVFLSAKQRMPGISLATVYNCLETLVECGLARQVNVEREATRFCPNLTDHGHIHCESCGNISDVPLVKDSTLTDLLEVPPRFRVTHAELTLRGICPSCQPSTHHS